MRSGPLNCKDTHTKLLARLNSRDAAGTLRLFTSSGTVYPGGTPLASFGAAFPPGDPTPGNAALRGMLRAVTGVDVPAANFDDATLALLDQGQVWFTPEQLIQLARLLKLDVAAR